MAPVNLISRQETGYFAAPRLIPTFSNHHDPISWEQLFGGLPKGMNMGIQRPARLSMLRNTCRGVILLALWSAPSTGQTTAELVNDGNTPESVLTQSMGYHRQSYSPLDQITRSNVRRLVPIWNASLMNDLGELAAPVVYNGVMYVING